MQHSRKALAPFFQRPDICGRVVEVAPQVFEVDFLPSTHCTFCGFRCRGTIHHCATHPDIQGSNWAWYCTDCFARRGARIGLGLGHRYRLRPYL